MSRKTIFLLSFFVVLMLFSYIGINLEAIFDGAGMTGKVTSTRLVVVKKDAAECNMTFEPGWNLVSFPCISEDMGIPMFTENMSNRYDTLRYYTSADFNDPWKSYNPNLPNWTIQDLSSVSKSRGYWIYVANTTSFYVNNTLSTPTLMDLPAGWNLIGYPNRTRRDVNDTFYALIPNYTYVHMYNASDATDPWKMFTWNESLPSDQDLVYTDMYYGYFIYLTEPKTLVIN